MNGRRGIKSRENTLSVEGRRNLIVLKGTTRSQTATFCLRTAATGASPGDIIGQIDYQYPDGTGSGVAFPIRWPSWGSNCPWI